MSMAPTDQASELRRLMALRQTAASPERGLPLVPAAPPVARPIGPERSVVRAAALPRSAIVSPPVRRRGACVLAIASGKGGVGKTNIAVNLAISLARRGRRTILVDADLGTANVDVMMNVQSRFDLSHVIRGERGIDEIAVPIEPGLRLIAGASGLSSVADLGPLERQTLIEQLARLESDAELILLDCGAGISQNVLAFAQSADQLLIVTTPEPTAMTDAYALAKVLCRAPWTPPMRLVISQAADSHEGQIIAQRLSAVAAKFLGVSLNCVGQVLRDPHVPQAVRQRSPFVVKYPQCPASSCIAALASRVDAGVAEVPARPGFFRRVFRFFY